MKSELELMQALKIEVGELKTQVNERRNLEVQVESLNATVSNLRKEMEGVTSLYMELNQLKASIKMLSTPSTPKAPSSSLKKRVGPR